MKPVVLSFLTDDDISHIAHGFDSTSLRKKRLQRWVEEAFEQGALLTQLDLACLLGVCDAVVSKYVGEIQQSGCILPTRGNIHDLSGAITHKREIITLYLEGFLTPEIALKTKHRGATCPGITGFTEVSEGGIYNRPRFYINHFCDYALKNLLTISY